MPFMMLAASSFHFFAPDWSPLNKYSHLPATFSGPNVQCQTRGAPYMKRFTGLMRMAVRVYENSSRFIIPLTGHIKSQFSLRVLAAKSPLIHRFLHPLGPLAVPLGLSAKAFKRYLKIFVSINCFWCNSTVPSNIFFLNLWEKKNILYGHMRTFPFHFLLVFLLFILPYFIWKACLDGLCCHV